MLGIGERHELPTILLIDDDLVSREVVATVLTLDGYQVHTAECGETALAKIHETPAGPLVVLMDAQLPGLSGAALAARLRAARSLTLIVISGSAIAPDLETAADGFLMKPFNPDGLRGLLAARAPHPPAPAPPLVVNPETLAQFRQLMPEPTVRQIYTAVVTDLKNRSAALGQALNAANSGQISRIGHAIKGGCGMAGALQAAHLGAQLESESNNLDYCRALASDLTAAIATLESMLEREFPG